MTIDRTARVPALSTLLLGITLAAAGCRPPAADLNEAYEPAAPGGAKAVDHSRLDRVLETCVDANGRVDYAKLHGDRKDLDGYVAMLKSVDFASLGRDDKLALLINAYNAFTLTLIVDHWPVASIKDIPAAERWKAKRWHIGTLTLSLDEIEHEYLRQKFKEPRIHFAVNCASVGCPPLRNEAYDPKRLEAQLQDQAVRMHNDKAWLALDAAKSEIRLTKLYDWFHGDFEQVSGSVLEHAAKFNKPLAGLLRAGKTPAIEWIEYDWSLNSKK